MILSSLQNRISGSTGPTFFHDIHQLRGLAVSPLNKHALHRASALSRPTLCPPGLRVSGPRPAPGPKPALASPVASGASSRPGSLRGEGRPAAQAELRE